MVWQDRHVITLVRVHTAQKSHLWRGSFFSDFAYPYLTRLPVITTNIQVVLYNLQSAFVCIRNHKLSALRPESTCLFRMGQLMLSSGTLLPGQCANPGVVPWGWGLRPSWPLSAPTLPSPNCPKLQPVHNVLWCGQLVSFLALSKMWIKTSLSNTAFNL